MNATLDLYVVVERAIFEADAAWLLALRRLAALDVAGLALQVRTKEESPAHARSLAFEARRATQRSRVPVLLNGTLDAARELGYDGAHWPEASIPASSDSAELWRGASVHSPEAGQRAARAGADFLVAGTIFDAGSKPAAGAGLDALRAMTAATGLPVLAIGGITPARVAACIEAGAAGVAVVTNVLLAPDMTAAVAALRDALDQASVAAGRA